MADAAKPLRILHLPLDIGGNVAGLAAAQRALGHDARSFSLQWSALGFNADENLEPPPGARFRLLRREMGRLHLFWRSVAWADVIHCHFGRTALSVRALPIPGGPDEGILQKIRTFYARLLWLADLPVLKARGKTVAVSFYGDEARIASSARRRNPHSHLHLPDVAGPLAGREELQREMIARFDRHADLIYATNPDLLDDLPARAKFLPYTNVDPAADGPAPWPVTAGLKILHMPTHRAVKGSDLLVCAVERLAAEGLDISLTQIENTENALARAAIASHHLLVDQLRVGWYGGVAVEAMMCGRPALAYLNKADLALCPPALAAEAPIIRADPDTLVSVLRDLALQPARLRDAGARSRRFVETWHDPRCIAANVLCDYTFTGPQFSVA